MTVLECGDNITISAVPTKTLHRDRFQLKGYLCPYHHDYIPTKKAVEAAGLPIQDYRQVIFDKRGAVA